ncbi:MAG: DUF3788 domain-containing protein [Spirochaetaceae bacterium]|jgi:hypothetical protein|nr:DUF3788 domain-containing protein [Spirochaetaceae bacterium]
MYERMLDKNSIPTEDEIKEYIGKQSVECIEIIKNSLERIFDINIELRFPFGNNYGWGYKFSNKSKHLFYLFFEKGSISIQLQISKIKTEKEIEKYNKLTEEGKNYWENRYLCGENGGWIEYRITNKKQLKDIGLFLSLRTNKEIEL